MIQETNLCCQANESCKLPAKYYIYNNDWGVNFTLCEKHKDKYLKDDPFTIEIVGVVGEPETMHLWREAREFERWQNKIDVTETIKKPLVKHHAAVK